ncbi:TonB-dependent receptor [Terrimonas sp. NA20]|uniref:TonB-dependent receptor n=1 Tax=Terrimonas ginsenosidimutans TaxID=2908004 RepID=A0ABS9KMG7_9BACT|nr:TonB-dependent receptor [Terrimonas ginsenosidimutans]MCG2613521.1 TonB-dependent receptor [Terrimonas ginsenosidimutans]
MLLTNHLFGDCGMPQSLMRKLLPGKSILLLIILSIFSCIGLRAQSITINQKSIPLIKVIPLLKQQTGYDFLYNAELFKDDKPVDIVVTNISLANMLDKYFVPRGITYDINKNEKTVVFKRKQTIPAAPPENPSAEITLTGRITNEKNEPLYRATINVKGTGNASTADSLGLYTLNIRESKTPVVLLISMIGYELTEVNANGRSVVNVSMKEMPKEMEDVVVIGYGTVQRKDLTGAVSALTDKDLKDIPINSAAQALQGRLAGVQIVVGEGAPGAPVDVFIRGRSSITQSGSPLYVVDGVQVENALDVLSPQDIESINVLKDAASTAIYGARGANGVVIITTKGGKNTNGKYTVGFNTFAGVNKLTKQLDMMDPYQFVMYQYEKAKYTASTNDMNSVSKYIRDPNNFDTIAPTFMNYPDAMDWQDRMMGRNAFQTTQNLNVSGGNQATQFNLSLTNNIQEGLLLYSKLDRKLVNFRLDQKISNAIKMGFNVRYNNQRITGAGTSDAGSANANRLRQYTRYRPLFLPGQDEEFYDQALSDFNPGNQLNLINPLLLSQAEYRLSAAVLYNFNGYVNINLFKGVSFRSTFGYDFTNTQGKSFDDTITANSKNNGARMPIAGLSDTRRSVINNSNVFTYSNNRFLGAGSRLTVLAGQEIFETRTVSNSQIVRYFPIGTTQEIAFANFGLATPPVGFTQPKPTSADIRTRQLSFFTRWSYDFKQKYLFSFNMRADGSSLFGPDYSNVFVSPDSMNNKWGFFPSASAAWKFSQEGFMKNISFVNDAKIRLSYGVSGNNRIDPYGYATNFSTAANSGYGLNDVLNYTLLPPARFGNANIKWESLSSANFGIDLSLFNRRLDVTVDVYSNRTKNLLVENSFPGNTGYRTQYQNVGTVRNNGVEIQLGGTVIKKKDFSWSSNFNISFNKNKVVSLGDQQQFMASSGFFATAGNPADYLIRKGQPIGTVFGLKVEGFYTVDDFDTNPITNAGFPGLTYQYTLKQGLPNPQAVISDLVQPGQIKYADVNGDGKIDLDDRTVIGNVLPTFTGGFTQQFAYRNFDLSVFMNFSYGNDVYNANKLELSTAYNLDANMLALMDERWRVIDANGQLVQKQLNSTTVIGVSPEELSALNSGARIWTPSRSLLGYYPSSFAVEDGSYLRINNITLGYTFSKIAMKKIKIASLRLYGTANNIATITGYSGYDPDVSSRRSILTPGVDYSAYPRGKSFIVGLNVIF